MTHRMLFHLPIDVLLVGVFVIYDFIEDFAFMYLLVNSFLARTIGLVFGFSDTLHIRMFIITWFIPMPRQVWRTLYTIAFIMYIFPESYQFYDQLCGALNRIIKSMFIVMSQLNGANGEVTNSDDVERSSGLDAALLQLEDGGFTGRTVKNKMHYHERSRKRKRNKVCEVNNEDGVAQNVNILESLEEKVEKRSYDIFFRRPVINQFIECQFYRQLFGIYQFCLLCPIAILCPVLEILELLLYILRSDHFVDLYYWVCGNPGVDAEVPISINSGNSGYPSMRLTPLSDMGYTHYLTVKFDEKLLDELRIKMAGTKASEHYTSVAMYTLGNMSTPVLGLIAEYMSIFVYQERLCFEYRQRMVTPSTIVAATYPRK
jgi:hypothetical protein